MDLKTLFARIKGAYNDQAKPIKIIIIAWVTLGVLMTAISCVAILIAMLAAVVKSAPSAIIALGITVLIIVVLALSIITWVILRKKRNTTEPRRRPEERTERTEREDDRPTYRTPERTPEEHTDDDDVADDFEFIFNPDE